ENLLEVRALAGKFDEAVDIGTSLIDRLGEDPAAAARVGRAQLRLARAAVAATRWQDAWPRIEAAREQAQRTGDQQLIARIDALTAHAAIGEDRFDEAEAAA